ncbi:hypothetical protein WLZ34_06840 [Thermogladius sp. KZ2Tp1]|uniref:hypothetical protein n=1 Tax=Thermogladius sp. KZ2Tp1 TaxID=3136289 RepID=UPI003DA7E3E2
MYNVALPPLAAGALCSYGASLRPELGAMAVVLCDIGAVLNPLGLLRAGAS